MKKQADMRQKVKDIAEQIASEMVERKAMVEDASRAQMSAEEQYEVGILNSGGILYYYFYSTVELFYC